MVSEVALAVVLLVGAGLFVGSFVRLMRIDAGFDYRNVLVQNVGLRVLPGQFAEALKRGNAYVDQMLDAVRRVPGVDGVAAVSGGLPLTGSWSRTGIELSGRPKLEGDDDSIDRRLVTTNYLQMLRIPLVRGRYLSDDDRAGAEKVIVVNETAAKKYWPGEDAIGQRVKMNSTERVVVGVVGDIRHMGPETPPRQECYIPFQQEENIGATLVMRTSGDPLAVLPAVKAAIWSVNKEQRLSSETVTLEALHGSPDCAAALQHGAPVALWPAGAGHRGSRHLRRHGVCGQRSERTRLASGWRSGQRDRTWWR